MLDGAALADPIAMEQTVVIPPDASGPPGGTVLGRIALVRQEDDSDTRRTLLGRTTMGSPLIKGTVEYFTPIANKSSR